MFTILTESITIGIIFWVIGTIVFNLSINKQNKNNQQPYGIGLAFFTTGIILYVITELNLIDMWFNKNESI